VPESVEARHILIAVKPDDDKAAKALKMKKAEKIRDQLVEKKGENFEVIAAEVSDCPSKSKGGMLGVFGRGQTVPAFEEAAFSQKVGEIGACCGKRASAIMSLRSLTAKKRGKRRFLK